MGEAAVNAARAVNYVGAGTVEFLVDSVSGEYFFCEMNTRLQVEHPVTEMVTGLDLVEWQLAVAAGRPLPLTEQADIDARLAFGRAGHAIEARVYAENPLKEFLPATGKLRRLREPTSPEPFGFLNGSGDPRNEGPHPATSPQTLSPPSPVAGNVTVRVDTGVREGDEVTMYYDPMISKLIVHGPDRPAALKALAAALRSYQVCGLPTNLSFLLRCVEHSAFAAGEDVTTAFLDDFGEQLLADEARPAPPLTAALAALAAKLAAEEGHSATSRAPPATGQAGAATYYDPWKAMAPSWRTFGAVETTMTLLDLNSASPSATEDASDDSVVAEGTYKISLQQRARDGTCAVTVASTVGPERLVGCQSLLPSTISLTEFHAIMKKTTINIHQYSFTLTGSRDASTGRMKIILATSASGEPLQNENSEEPLMNEGGLRFEVDTAVLESDTGTTVHLFQSADSANGFGPRFLAGDKEQSCDGRLTGDRQSYAFLLPKPDFNGSDSSGSGAGAVKAPMPGKVCRRHLSTLELLSSISQC